MHICLLFTVLPLLPAVGYIFHYLFWIQDAPITKCCHLSKTQSVNECTRLLMEINISVVVLWCVTIEHRKDINHKHREQQMWRITLQGYARRCTPSPIRSPWSRNELIWLSSVSFTAYNCGMAAICHQDQCKSNNTYPLLAGEKYSSDTNCPRIYILHPLSALSYGLLIRKNRQKSLAIFRREQLISHSEADGVRSRRFREQSGPSGAQHGEVPESKGRTPRQRIQSGPIGEVVLSRWLFLLLHCL